MSPAAVTQRPQPNVPEPGNVQHGLVRPLFERLVDLGHPVHLLCQQYRSAASIMPRKAPVTQDASNVDCLVDTALQPEAAVTAC